MTKAFFAVATGYFTCREPGAPRSSQPAALLLTLLLMGGFSSLVGCRSAERAADVAQDQAAPLPLQLITGGSARINVIDPRTNTQLELTRPGGELTQWTSELSGRSRTVYAREGQRLTVRSEDDLRSGVRVTYEPPLDLSPTWGSVRRSRMRVTNLVTGTPRDEGWCDYEVKVFAAADLAAAAAPASAEPAPAATQPAPLLSLSEGWVLEITRQLDLKLAQGQVLERTWYSPQGLWLQQHIQQRLMTMGFIPLKVDEYLRRKELAQP